MIARPEGNIVVNRIAEQLIVRVLEEHPDAGPLRRDRLPARQGSAATDLPLTAGEQTGEQADQGGLAGAVTADQGDAVAGLDGQRDIVQRQGPIVVAMRDPLQGVERLLVQAAKFWIVDVVHYQGARWRRSKVSSVTPSMAHKRALA